MHYLLYLNIHIFSHSLVLPQFCQNVVHLSCSVETKILNGSIMYISVVKNIDISISIDTEISERYQY